MWKKKIRRFGGVSPIHIPNVVFRCLVTSPDLDHLSKQSFSFFPGLLL